jgi:DNA-binding Lrp family transcriptional regulator
MNDKALQQVEPDNVPFSNSDNPITAIARIAASGAGKEVVEQMMALVDWDEKRRATAEFNAAFSNAKQKFKKAKKSGYNAHLNTYYSLLEDYDEATREALAEFGLSWRHVPATLPGDITSITCVLAHRSGHSEKAEMQAPSYSMTNNAVNKLQSVGIVNMYLKRLTLSAMLGLVSDSELDNDGNGGGEQITENQAADVKALAEEVGADIPAFLKYLEKKGKTTINTISEIPANMHHDAVAALEQKRNKK